MNAELHHVEVLHCAETIKGGIATYLRELVICQARDFGADRVAVIVPASQVKELPVPDGVVVLTYPDGASRARNALMLAAAVGRFVRRQNPGVVHVHSTFAGAVVRPLLAVTGRTRRVIYCPHGWAWVRAMPAYARKITQWIERGLAHLSDSVVCISEHERELALEAGISPNKLSVVLNGIAERAPQPEGPAPDWPEGRRRLLFVGRFDQQKGVDLFCAALRNLGDEAHGVLAGDAVLADARTIKLPANAQAVGWVTPTRLETLFRSADVLVVPSRWEGFGLIAAEAMRAGLPVLAARVGGLPEVVADGETGVLFEPGDVQAMVRAVRRHEPEQWRRMGHAGKARFQNQFTMERVHTQLCELYELPLPQMASVSCMR
jgi:glycosyltransferase involved in cell wall biosynthesis